mgnify:CR=1 FL=1
MIYYFSATGNSKHVALSIARALHIEAVDILTCDAQNAVVDASGAPVGVVTPTYFGGLPEPVCDFLSRIGVTNTPYCFIVSTCGYLTGAAPEMAESLGWRFDAAFSVRFADTFTIAFDVSDKAKVWRKTRRADEQLESVIRRIMTQTRGRFNERALPLPAVRAVYPLYGVMAKTRHFRVSDACISCGQCARKCPVHAITMVDGHPH